MFDHLDDPNPPTFHADARAQVARHRNRLVRRRRSIIAVSVSVTVLTGIGIATVAASGSTVRLNVTVPATSPASTIGPATTTAPATTVTPRTTTPPVTTPQTTITTTVPIGTQGITYPAFTATGTVNPHLRVTSRVSGTCVGGRRYYRCFANQPSGPFEQCFAGPHGTAAPLVCVWDPRSFDVVELTPTSVTSLPSSGGTSAWAMELSNGQTCLFVPAAWSGLGPYDCRQLTSSSPLVADCHGPTPAEPWWAAECQDEVTAASPFVATRIIKVWY